MKQAHGVIEEISTRVQRFDSNGDDEITTDDEIVDLFRFAELVQSQIDDPDIKAAAAELMAAIEDYVVAEDQYELGWSGGFTDDEGFYHYWNHTNSHGVSIFFPDYSRSFYKGSWLDFAAGTEWDIEPSAGLTPGGDDATSTTIEWGPMLVEYVRETNPDAPDDPRPPELVAPLSRVTSVHLPVVLRGRP
jgi:hypothetical protein